MGFTRHFGNNVQPIGRAAAGKDATLVSYGININVRNELVEQHFQIVYKESHSSPVYDTYMQKIRKSIASGGVFGELGEGTLEYRVKARGKDERWFFSLLEDYMKATFIIKRTTSEEVEFCNVCDELDLIL